MSEDQQVINDASECHLNQVKETLLNEGANIEALIDGLGNASGLIKSAIAALVPMKSNVVAEYVGLIDNSGNAGSDLSKCAKNKSRISHSDDSACKQDEEIEEKDGPFGHVDNVKTSIQMNNLVISVLQNAINDLNEKNFQMQSKDLSRSYRNKQKHYKNNSRESDVLNLYRKIVDLNEYLQSIRENDQQVHYVNYKNATRSKAGILETFVKEFDFHFANIQSLNLCNRIHSFSSNLKHEINEKNKILRKTPDIGTVIERDETRKQYLSVMKKYNNDKTVIDALESEEKRADSWQSRLGKCSIKVISFENKKEENFKDVADMVKKVVQEIKDWNSSTLQQRTQSALAEVKAKLRSSDLDLFMNPRQLYKELDSLYDSQLLELKYHIKGETPFREKIENAYSKLLSYSQFASNFVKKIRIKHDELMKDFNFHLMGASTPQTNKIEEKLDTIEGLQYKIEDLEHEIKRLRRKPGNETEIQKNEMNVRMIREKRLKCAKELANMRAHFINRAKLHYPELLFNEKYRRSIGLESVIPELVETGIWFHDASEEDFEIVSTERTMGGKRILKVKTTNDGETVYKILKRFDLGNTSAQRHFQRQCALLRRLENMSFVIHIEGVFAQGGYGYIIMPYYSKQDLGTLLLKEPNIREEKSKCKQIAKDILHGLNHIHAQNHVHCDIKPSNIFINKDYRALIGDFDGLRDYAQTHTSIQSTLEYLSPEYKDGRVRRAHPKMDMYSYGKILEFLQLGNNHEANHLSTLLLDNDPEMRPDASRLLMEHPLFKDDCSSLVFCQVCKENFLEEKTTCCENRHHFCCATCFQGYIGAGYNIDVQDNLSVRCFGSGCEAIVSSESFRPLISNEIWAELLKRVYDRNQKKIKEQMEAQFREELQRNQNELVARQHLETINSTILTLCCPHCSKAFFDFDACFALNCSDEQGNGCGIWFCAWCLKVCGTNNQDAHQHVATCPQNLSRDQDALFGDQQKRDQEMRRLRAERIMNYWQEYIKHLNESIRRTLAESLSRICTEDLVYRWLLPSEIRTP